MLHFPLHFCFTAQHSKSTAQALLNKAQQG